MKKKPISFYTVCRLPYTVIEFNYNNQTIKYTIPDHSQFSFKEILNDVMELAKTIVK